MKRVAGSPDLRAKLGANARERASDFRPERLAARVEAIYTQVTER
jgi:glycosyltransferase involved in cell wall biosynthesis